MWCKVRVFRNVHQKVLRRGADILALIFWLHHSAMPSKGKETGAGSPNQTGWKPGLKELFNILANLPFIIITIVDEFRELKALFSQCLLYCLTIVSVLEFLECGSPEPFTSTVFHWAAGISAPSHNNRSRKKSTFYMTTWIMVIEKKKIQKTLNYPF